MFQVCSLLVGYALLGIWSAPQSLSPGVCGPLTFGGWLVYMGWHEEKHLGLGPKMFILPTQQGSWASWVICPSSLWPTSLFLMYMLTLSGLFHHPRVILIFFLSLTDQSVAGNYLPPSDDGLHLPWCPAGALDLPVWGASQCDFRPGDPVHLLLVVCNGIVSWCSAAPYTVLPPANSGVVERLHRSLKTSLCMSKLSNLDSTTAFSFSGPVFWWPQGLRLCQVWLGGSECVCLHWCT